MSKILRTVAVVPLLGMALLSPLVATQGTAYAQQVKNAVTSKGVEDNTPYDKPFKPIDVTTTFSTSDPTVYVTYKLGKPMEGYGRSVWSAVDVASMPQGKIMGDVRTVTLPNLQFLKFSFTQTNAWPVGKYKIDLYANDNMMKTLYFSVQ